MNGQTIGPYELEHLLGEGGIGQVYAAQDRVLGREVAIKMLRPELSRDRNFVERFYVEAKSLANLNHTNITTLYQLHAEATDAYMVMELVRGVTLDALLKKAQRLCLRDALAVLAQAVPGLRYAHRRGIIHRDIKLTNLMITEDGVLKIMDFGIARVRGSQHLTQVGEFCGTYLYASPEQIKGEEVDERSDLYSLAIVFYRMLAGAAPFTAENEYALMTAQLQQAPAPLLGRVPEVDPVIDAALLRALAKRPEDRFASVEEFGRAVGALALRGESSEILQQLYERMAGGDNPEKTRVAAMRYPTGHSEAPPMPEEWRSPAAPAMAASHPSAIGPSTAGRVPPPEGALAAAPKDPPQKARVGTGRKWALAGLALALLLTIGGGYQLLAGGRVGLLANRPQNSNGSVLQGAAPSNSESAAEENVAQPSPMLAHSSAPMAAAGKITGPAAGPGPTETADTAADKTVKPSQPSTQPPPPAAQPTDDPAAGAAATDQASAASSETAPGALAESDAQPVAPSKADSTTRRAAAATEPAGSGHDSISARQPRPEMSAGAGPSPATGSHPAPNAAQLDASDDAKQPAVRGTATSIGPNPQQSADAAHTAASAAGEVHVATAEPPAAPAPPARTPPLAASPAPAGQAAGSVQEPSAAAEKSTSNQASVQVATAEPPAPNSPASAAAPPAVRAQQPEGPPDLEGRVTGLKGLGQIELDKKKWIKLYGITDPARGSREQQHTTALIGYLKSSHNHLVCYRKPADSYRCYSDGNDIARLALLDRLVQLAPGAPAEYRELLKHQR